MFVPPRCPNRSCVAFRNPEDGFFVRKGYYYPRCRPRGVPRFRCKRCRRGFSRQTFRQDYYDKKPHTNAALLALLASGVGLRQSARLLAIRPRSVELKFVKMARHLVLFHENLRGELPRNVRLQLDEMETFEGNRRTRPLTLPLLIEEESMFILGGESAPIPPSGSMPERRRREIRASEDKFGKRRNESSACVRRVLRGAARLLRADARVTLTCDRKSTYTGLATKSLGEERVVVDQYSSKLRRDTRNPLFKINLTNALARDLNGRLRRRSWLASKRRERLNLQLGIFLAWRNYHRFRFNRDRSTPAQFLGFCPRRLSKEELLAWRQDWGRLSIDVRRAA